MTLQNNFGLPFFWDTNSFDIGVELFEINTLKSFLSLPLFILMVNTVWLSSMDNGVTCPNSIKAPMASIIVRGVSTTATAATGASFLNVH